MGRRRRALIAVVLAAAPGCGALDEADRADVEISNPCLHQQVVRLWTGYVPPVRVRAAKETHVIPPRETVLIPGGFPPGVADPPEVYYVETVGLGGPRWINVYELDPEDTPLEFSIPRETCAVGRGG